MAVGKCVREPAATALRITIGACASLERRAPRQRAARRSAGEEVSRYQSTMSSPNQSADHPAERQERPERDRLLARLGPWRAIIATPTTAPAAGRPAPPGRSRARGRSPSSRPASRRPCPCPAGRRGDQQECAARRGDRDRALGEARRGRSRARSPIPATAPASTNAFGMIRSSRSVSVIATRTAQRTSPSTSSPASSVAERQHGPRPERAERRLGQRIARRDRLAAVAAAAPEDEPGDDRDVVVGGDRAPQPGHRERPVTNPSPRGTRWAITVIRLPMKAPATNAIRASGAIGGSDPIRRAGGGGSAGDRGCPRLPSVQPVSRTTRQLAEASSNRYGGCCTASRSS